MKWWERHLGTVVHFVFICVAALFFAVPIRATSQQHDSYLYEKMREQERHIDSTDQTVKENKLDVDKIRDMMEENRETIGEYKAYFLGVSGAIAFLNLLGLIKQFNSGKESNG